jgi:hypothetical protein
MAAQRRRRSASAACTCGIRDEQPAKASPHRKNKPPMAILAARIAVVVDASGVGLESRAGMQADDLGYALPQ